MGRGSVKKNVVWHETTSMQARPSHRGNTRVTMTAWVRRALRLELVADDKVNKVATASKFCVSACFLCIHWHLRGRCSFDKVCWSLLYICSRGDYVSTYPLSSAEAMLTSPLDQCHCGSRRIVLPRLDNTHTPRRHYQYRHAAVLLGTRTAFI